jgi:hypothetical protein
MLVAIKEHGQAKAWNAPTHTSNCLTKEAAVAAMRALRLDSASIVVRAMMCASRSTALCM